MSGSAAAQALEEITVQGSRAVEVKNVGTTSSGYKVKDISLSYGVSTAGMDLASAAGAEALAQRVNDAAKAATKKAMVKAHARVQAAGKASAE